MLLFLSDNSLKRSIIVLVTFLISLALGSLCSWGIVVSQISKYILIVKSGGSSSKPLSYNYVYQQCA